MTNTLKIQLFSEFKTVDKICLGIFSSIGVAATYFLFSNNTMMFLYLGGAAILTSLSAGMVNYLKERKRIVNANEFTCPFGDTYKVYREKTTQTVTQTTAKTSATEDTSLTRKKKRTFEENKKIAEGFKTPPAQVNIQDNSNIDEIIGLKRKVPKKNKF